MSGLDNKSQLRTGLEAENKLQDLSIRGVCEEPCLQAEHEVVHELSRGELSIPRPEVAPGLEPGPTESLGLDCDFVPAQELQMLERVQDVDMTQGPQARTISFKGHTGGGRTMLDRLVTLIADFIKLLEVKFFRWIERRRAERAARKMSNGSTVTVVTPEAPQTIGVTPKRKRSGFRNLIRWS